MSTSPMMDANEVLAAARGRHYEDPAGAERHARDCRARAAELGDDVLAGRSLGLEAAIAVHRGDLAAALARLEAARPYEQATQDDVLVAELSAVRSHLGFFVGSYADSLIQAERAIELADRVGDRRLRVFARRSACLAFGNLGIDGWPEHLAELLRLTVEIGDRYEEALSRNDLAHSLMLDEDFAGAERQIERAHDLADEHAPDNGFLLAVLSCTRAEMRLRAGRPGDALSDAGHAMDMLGVDGANPYILAATVVVRVQALLALGRLDEAVAATRSLVDRLGDRVPQPRSQVLAIVARALREAGRLEEAYDALEASAALERRASAELSELQRGLERAALARRAVRRRTDALAARNRRQTDALTAQNRRLEAEQQRLRDEAHRDALTGLHNRRFLHRAMERLAAEPSAGPISFAVLDLDHFKAINDRFGHSIGDRVLVRVAELLRNASRDHDAVVRMGGEEFVLVMPQTAAADATAACERLRAQIAREPWQLVAPGLTVTVSVGLATAATAADLEEVARHADALLYAAKDAGRDRVATAP